MIRNMFIRACKRAARVPMHFVVSLCILCLGMVAAEGALGQQKETYGGGAENQPSLLFRGQQGRAASPESSAGVSFLPAVLYDSAGIDVLQTNGGTFQGIAVADVNGDGKADIIVADLAGPGDTGDGVVAVLLGNGDGTFRTATTYDSGGIGASALAVADVNGDGTPDIVVGNVCSRSGDCSTSTIAVLLGNGDGTFQPAVTYSSGGHTVETVSIVDVNGDGKPDLVVANESGVSVLLGNGDGTFQPAVTYSTGAAFTTSAAVADVNNDGYPDIVAVSASVPTVSVFLGNGDGTFQPAMIDLWATGGFIPQSVAIADVNQDGKPDVVVANWYSGTLAVLLGNGDGTFQPAVPYPSGGASPSAVFIVDVNGDGVLDLVAANCGTITSGYACGSSDGVVSVLLGNGDGTFQPAVALSSGAYNDISVAIADVNGDGKPDLVAGNGEGGNNNGASVAVLLNNTGSSVVSNTTVTSSQNPSSFGEAVTFTATVGSQSGTPSGTVAFFDGTSLLGSSGLVSGMATISAAPVAAGTQSITATYEGSVDFGFSKSAPFMQSVSKATTTTGLSSSLNPVPLGQVVTFTATVAGEYGGNITGGTVTFYLDGQKIWTSTVTGGSASVTSTFSGAPGTVTISAAYSGNGNTLGSTSGNLTETIATPTKTALVSSLNPAFGGQAVTFTATVSSASGAPPNGEMITFNNGATVLGTAPLSGGKASLTTSTLPGGTDLITATYPGDSTFWTSTSGRLRQRILVSETTTQLSSGLNPSNYGQAVTFTATVTASYGSVPDGETVTFYDGAVEIGTNTTLGGVASFTTSSLKTGSHTIKAAYAGDPAFRKSRGTVTQVVNRYSTSTILTSSLNPSIYGQAVTWTATVTSTGPYVPTGMVKFAGIGAAKLSGGVATLTKAWLNAGTYPTEAEYEGDDTSAPSTSSRLNQVVNPASTTTTVTSSVNPSTYGQSVTFTATVATSTGVNSAGTVTFTAGGTTLGTATLNEDVATLSTSALPLGTTLVEATYNGETNFTGSSGSVSQTVNP